MKTYKVTYKKPYTCEHCFIFISAKNRLDAIGKIAKMFDPLGHRVKRGTTYSWKEATLEEEIINFIDKHVSIDGCKADGECDLKVDMDLDSVRDLIELIKGSCPLEE